MRALPRASIPAHLWSDQIMILPTQLCAVYGECLNSLGMYEEACGPSPPDSELIGGSSDQDTINHFTHRFAASAVRIEYLALDPNESLGNIPSDLLITLCDGRIAVLDVPCGTGAGILSLLGTIAELRRSKVVSSLPLYVHVTAGDCSPKALEIYEVILEEIQPWLVQQGINVTWNKDLWHAERPESTSDLVTSWLSRNANAEEYIVLIAAFSGEAATQFDAYKRTFEHISERLYGRRSSIVWVEPIWHKAERLFKRVHDLFEKMPWFSEDPTGALASRFLWLHPFNQKHIRGSILVKKYSRR